MAKRLAGKVVVLTGASSGIGRAAALRFAREGAAVCLAARSREALDTVRREVEGAGGRAAAFECDVSDEEQVERLAREAEGALGPIDVWVNDAGIFAMGRFEDTPPEVFRKVVETDFMGTVHGTRAALRRFEARGRGTVVNVASIDGRVAAPYTAAYAASKHAVVGFSAAIRQELRLEGRRSIHVCTVLPATIDTPLFQKAANFTGEQVRAMPPVYSPERAARVIVALALRPRREALVGTGAYLLSALWALAPAAAEALVARRVRRSHPRPGHAAGESDGNTFGPTRPEGATGGWRRSRRRRLAALVLPAAAVLAGAAWLRSA
jgi:NAD(P)-dependent dehydrogenase (short-subunit alcohol dehydrogenase family)